MNKVAAFAMIVLAVVALAVGLSMYSAEAPEPPPVPVPRARIVPASTVGGQTTIAPAPRITPFVVPGGDPAPAPIEEPPDDGDQDVEELEPTDKGGQAPSGELTRRMDGIIATLPAETRPTNLNWNCAEGGIDCSLTGLIVSNQALKELAEKLEGPSPYGGTDRPPTVEIQKVEETGDGKAFEIGVFIP
jgi:hypothetical protein